MAVDPQLGAIFRKEGAGSLFQLTLKPMRGNRWGYFRPITSGLPQIVVKSGLSPSTMLFVFLHEKAHWVVWNSGGRKNVRPHGPEWQEAFRILLAPYLHPDWFDEPTLRVIARHMRKPKATVGADPALLQALNGPAAPLPAGHHKLKELPEGTVFQVKHHTLVRGELRRTRIMCRTLTGKQSFLVHGEVPVVPLGRD